MCSPRPPQNSPPLPGPALSTNAYIPTHVSPGMAPSVQKPTTASFDQDRFKKPWKYEGYQSFGDWMASDDDFFLFRRFQSLNAQTILWMQDRIAQIEERLEEIHKNVEHAEKLRNDSFRWDEKCMQERYKLMGELSGLLHHYNQYIEAFSRVRSRPKAEKRQTSNVQNWLARGAISEAESAFSKYGHDMISIGLRSRPPLGRWLESIPSLHLMRPFRARPSPLKKASQSTSYSSNTSFDRFTDTTVVTGGLTMLLAPLWWLEFTSSSVTRLEIISGFVCMFALVMMLATVNRPFEVVASAAAYSAVLMVFMQIK